jgi:hypothetical protein
MRVEFLMKSLFRTGLLVIWTWTPLQAQEVEHNYVVGPQNTNCDSLELVGLSTDEAISAITNTKFRLDQQFKLNRPQGLRAGAFHSCDNQSGFLIILFDRRKHLFPEVPLSTWDTFVTSPDPEDFFLQKIKPVFDEYQ